VSAIGVMKKYETPIERLKEAVGGVFFLLVMIAVVWYCSGGAGYPGWPPGFLPGHNLVSQSFYNCPAGPSDEGVLDSSTYAVIFGGTCTKELYGDGMIVYRAGAGTEHPGEQISAGRDERDMHAFYLPQ
jgi:hypothetical protein